MHTPKVYNISDLEKAPDSQERNDSARGKSHLVVNPGGMVGMDQYLIRRPEIQIRTTLVS